MTALPLQRARRMVIIDDTRDLRDLLALAFRKGGFDVVGEAGDGSVGIDVVRATRPDLVLLDLAMPVLDGIEALPTIRRLCPAARIVVLSGFGAQQMSARAVAAGADGYVQKAAPLATILDYVRDLVDDMASGPAPALALVPAASPAEADLPVDPTPESRRGVSSWEALGLAPYGVVELTDEPLSRIVHLNPVAQRLLDSPSPGAPLSGVAPELAAQVAYHRLDADATFEIEVPGGRVRATQRRTGRSVLVYLDSTVEDVGLLRRAIATTAHEIRGPVAVLCGIAETMGWEGDLVDDAQRDRLMASVARQARMLDSITADLLTAAQIQRGALRLDMQLVDARAAVDAALSDGYDATVTVEDDRLVRADPLRLAQMFTNLLGNAVKYGAAPYSVVVRPDDTREDRVCIDVVDHGPGVPAEFGARLFTEFARADDAVARGTGLGLYVVRTLAEAQKGSASYRPGEDGGSVFTITLLAGRGHLF
jgi:signal transduction histidine kinase/DNA-binding NarL/FixJ family response regulator